MNFECGHVSRLTMGELLNNIIWKPLLYRCVFYNNCLDLLCSPIRSVLSGSRERCITSNLKLPFKQKQQILSDLVFHFWAEKKNLLDKRHLTKWTCRIIFIIYRRILNCGAMLYMPIHILILLIISLLFLPLFYISSLIWKKLSLSFNR